MTNPFLEGSPIFRFARLASAPARQSAPRRPIDRLWLNLDSVQRPGLVMFPVDDKHIYIHVIRRLNSRA